MREKRRTGLMITCTGCAYEAEWGGCPLGKVVDGVMERPEGSSFGPRVAVGVGI